MHYRSAVLVVIVVSLTLGAPLQAQITFVSPGAAASKAIREAAARQEDQRRQEERERIARERLALEERRVALQEQLVAEEAATAREEQAELQAAAPAPEPTPAAEPFQLVLVDREQLAAVLQYLHDVGLSRDQLSDVLDLLLETQER